MTATVETKIWLAMRSRVQSALPVVPKAWPGETFEPPYGGNPPALQHYIRVGRVVAAPVRQLIADGRPHLRSGFLVLTLVYPLGQSVTVYDQMAGQIAAHFADGTCMSHQGVSVSVPEYPHVLEGFEENGYWTVPVRIPWQCYT